MIPKITKGDRVRGLLEYLYGPGKAEEHTNPHIVAGYDDAAALEPSRDDEGRPTLGGLAARLDAPELAAGDRGVRQYVWQCSLSLPSDDRQVSDQEWREIAEKFVSGMGFTGDEQSAGCRWVAVHHGRSVNNNDHIHIVVTLATEDGAPVWLHQDYPRAHRLCRELEVEYNLDQRVRRDGVTTRPASTRMEIDQARREDRWTDRDLLRLSVRTAAAGADTEAGWIRGMRERGLLVVPRADRANPEQIVGYAVALKPEDRNGKPRWFAGHQLDGDLSIVRVRQRWAEAEPLNLQGWDAMKQEAVQLREFTAEQRVQAWRTSAAALERITGTVGRVGVHSPEWPAVARSTVDVLTAVAAVAEPNRAGPVSRAADRLARAAAPSRPMTPSPMSDIATNLSRISTAILMAGAVKEPTDEALVLLVMVQATRLVVQLAELEKANQRMSAAAAARAAAAELVPVFDRAVQAGVLADVTASSLDQSPGVPDPELSTGERSRPRAPGPVREDRDTER